MKMEKRLVVLENLAVKQANRIEQLEQQVAELDTKRAMLVAALMQSSGMSHDEIEDMLKQANPPEGE
jgi:uncharacterized coiled-coil protein SlyX